MSFGLPQDPQAVGDSTTGDLLPGHDLVGERPPKKSRQAAWREKNGLKAITVNLPAAVVDAFHDKRKKQGKDAAAVILKLIETQYLRGR